jgi:hypothetical protein
MRAAKAWERVRVSVAYGSACVRECLYQFSLRRMRKQAAALALVRMSMRLARSAVPYNT